MVFSIDILDDSKKVSPRSYKEQGGGVTFKERSFSPLSTKRMKLPEPKTLKVTLQSQP